MGGKLKAKYFHKEHEREGFNPSGLFNTLNCSLI